MTKFIKTPIAISLAFLMFSGMVSAQQVKIGFVNYGRLIGESPQAAIAEEALREEFAPRQREGVALQTELQQKQEQIQRDLDVMGPEERRNAERDLRKNERELARQQQEFSEDFNLRRNESLRKVQSEVLREVQAFVAAEGFDLVVSDGVLYSSPAIDITEQVLAELKANFAAESGG
jgi:outer membrane protein